MTSQEQKGRPAEYSSRLALAIYVALSLMVFGRGLAGHFSDRLIGVGPDPALFVFFLTWWPYAALNHLNPFLNHVIWTPDGFNMAWTTFVPLAGAIAAPITLLAGPVPAYNTMMLLCPALSAWTAFLLCRQICGYFWPSVAGGYVYGFSAYMLSHMLGHLTLVMAFFPPLAVYLALRRIGGSMSARRFASIFALVLIGQIGSSLEILATLTIFGGIALAMSWWLGGAELRPRLVALVAPIACAYLIAAAVASPYLYYFFFVAGPPNMATNLSILGAATPANLAIPSPINALGALHWSRALSVGQNIYETSGYVGLPMILLVWNLARSRWNEFGVKLAVAMFLIVCASSFGPDLLIGGRFALPMPWKPFTWLPLLDKAEPGRFAILSFLSLAIIFALWLSNTAIASAARIASASIMLIFLLPNPAASFWTSPVDTPQFFSSAAYQQYLRRGDNVLILPYGLLGNVDLWQASTWMDFRTAGGYVGLSPAIPADYQPWPIVYALYNLAEIPDLSEQVNAFLVQKRVNAVIVASGGSHLWEPVFSEGPLTFRLRPFSPDEQEVIRAFFSPLDPAPIEAGGVTIYRIPLEQLGAYSQIDPRELEVRAAHARLDALITAADQYLSQGKSLADLNPLMAARLGLLPKTWLTGPNLQGQLMRYKMQNGIALGADRNGRIIVGLRGSKRILQEIARDYDHEAAAVSILPPMLSFSPAEQTQWILLMTFDRERLSQAAAKVRQR